MNSRIEQLIDNLEDYISNCKTQAFSNTKIICERDALREMIGELRRQLPDELNTVQRIISNQDNIIAKANAKAREIVDSAQKRASELIDQDNITKEAFEKAKRVEQESTDNANTILNDAIGEATSIRVGAINYTTNLMNNVDKIIENALQKEREYSERMIATYTEHLDVLRKNKEELKIQMNGILNGGREEIVEEIEALEGTYDEE